ncbi:hypothetical protein LINGRAHAP2_LOCUS4377 [Linum grandiflorum]
MFHMLQLMLKKNSRNKITKHHPYLAIEDLPSLITTGSTSVMMKLYLHSTGSHGMTPGVTTRRWCLSKDYVSVAHDSLKML